MADPQAYTVSDNIDKSRFEVDLGDGIFAFAEYRLGNGRIAFTHTEVPPAYEGRGIATELIRFALQFARDRGLKVAPICPFVAAYFKAHAEEQDLLDPVWKAKLGLA